MKNRTIFAVILVPIMILTMIGCGKKSESALNDSVSEEQDVTDEIRLKRIILHSGDQNDDDVSWYEYMYDENGFIVQEDLLINVDVNGTAESEICKTKWEYNSEGNLTKIMCKWSPDFAFGNWWEEYYYNDKVTVPRRNHYTIAGGISHAYSEFGLGEKIKKHNVYSVTGEISGEHNYSYKYYEGGKIKEEYRDNTLCCIYEYDENGNCISIQNSGGYRIKYQYDKYGNLIKVIRDGIHYECEFINEYDADGNIIKKTEVIDGEVTSWCEYIYESVTTGQIIEQVTTTTPEYVTDEVITPTEIETTTSDEFYGKFKDYSEYVELGKYSRMDIMVNPASDGDFQKQQMEYQRNVWDRVMDNCKILGYPEEQLRKLEEHYFEYYSESFKKAAEIAEISYEEYLAKNNFENEEALKQECIKLAQSELEYTMIGMEIAKKEHIVVTEEIYNTYIEQFAQNNEDFDLEEYEEEYGADYIMESVVFELVCKWLLDNNTLVERIW